ncbi:MAG TPA: cupin domain-containing protein [Spirochaetota bacterium]|mgnify:CR=1 FL=1|nr:cupin domain-containing protein [Spirochaetota bacterium]
MEIKNIKSELKNAPIDLKANIKLIKLTGDKNISVFAAEILPKTKLNPHYHKNGIETYQIYQGTGIMKVGELNDNKVKWNETFDVKTGDCFTIVESQIHQIINDSDEILIALFTCPEPHLGDDRFFINS